MAAQQTAGNLVEIIDLTGDSGQTVLLVKPVEDSLEYGWVKKLQDEVYGITLEERPGVESYDVEYDSIGSAVAFSAYSSQLRKDVKKAIKGTIKKAPELQFSEVRTDNEDGSRAIVIFHDGRLAHPHPSFPSTQAGVTLSYDRNLQKVTITIANPLVKVKDDKLTKKVREALQALSVTEDDDES